jgi:hypothetical protein
LKGLGTRQHLEDAATVRKFFSVMLPAMAYAFFRNIDEAHNGLPDMAVRIAPDVELASRVARRLSATEESAIGTFLSTQQISLRQRAPVAGPSEAALVRVARESMKSGQSLLLAPPSPGYRASALFQYVFAFGAAYLFVDGAPIAGCAAGIASMVLVYLRHRHRLRVIMNAIQQRGAAHLPASAPTAMVERDLRRCKMCSTAEHN